MTTPATRTAPQDDANKPAPCVPDWVTQLAHDQAEAFGIDPDTALLVTALYVAAMAGTSAHAALSGLEEVHGDSQVVLLDGDVDKGLVGYLERCTGQALKKVKGKKKLPDRPRELWHRQRRVEDRIADLYCLNSVHFVRTRCGPEVFDRWDRDPAHLEAYSRVPELRAMGLELVRLWKEQDALLFALRPLAVVPLAGPAEIAALRARGTDGSLLEITAASDLPDRLRAIPAGALQKMAAFRQSERFSSCPPVFASFPVFSSFWGLAPKQYDALRAAPALAGTGLFDSQIVVRPGSSQAPGRRRKIVSCLPELLATLLVRRLHVRKVRFDLRVEAAKAVNHWVAGLPGRFPSTGQQRQAAKLLMKVVLGIAVIWMNSPAGESAENFRCLPIGGHAVIGGKIIATARDLLDKVDWQLVEPDPRGPGNRDATLESLLQI